MSADAVLVHEEIQFSKQLGVKVGCPKCGDLLNLFVEVHVVRNHDRRPNIRLGAITSGWPTRPLLHE